MIFWKTTIFRKEINVYLFVKYHAEPKSRNSFRWAKEIKLFRDLNSQRLLLSLLAVHPRLRVKSKKTPKKNREARNFLEKKNVKILINSSNVLDDHASWMQDCDIPKLFNLPSSNFKHNKVLTIKILVQQFSYLFNRMLSLNCFLSSSHHTHIHQR